MMTDIDILHGDNVDEIPKIAARSVQCAVTSPPYYGLRDYGLPPTAWPEIAYQPMPGLPPVVIPAQSACLGLETTPEAYTAHLVHVFRLVREVLADDGVVWLNLGDSYGTGTRAARQMSRTSTMISAGQHEAQGSRHGGPAKQMFGIPWRVAFALQADGWYLRSDVIWQKPNAMPESIKDRPTKDHEYVFLLAKSEKYYFDHKVIQEPVGASTIQRLSQPTLAQQAGGPKDYGTTGVNPNRSARKTLENLKKRLDEDGSLKRNKRTVWSINTKPLAEAHYAPMPEALAEPCILSSSRPGDTVLDPFGGTGTTARVALANGRRAISIDKNPAYIEIHYERTSGVQRRLI